MFWFRFFEKIRGVMVYFFGLFGSFVGSWWSGVLGLESWIFSLNHKRIGVIYSLLGI